MALVSFRACQNAFSVRRFLVVLLLNVSCAYAETLLEHSVSAELDWQPMTALTDSEESLRCQQCGGKYVDPLSRLVKADFPVFGHPDLL